MKKNNDIIVYTAIANNYDDLIDPKFISSNIDYYCFTDDMSMKSEVWNLIEFPLDDLNSTYKNRIVKMLPHKYFSEYKYSVYIDGSIDILGDIEKLVNEYLVEGEYKLAVPKHPERDCLYEEAKACINLKKDNVEIIKKQISKYKEENFPKGFGLTENGIIFRQHNDPEVINLMQDWWDEFNKFSQRDQLSFLYVIWKNNFNYLSMNINSRVENKYFRIRGHKKDGIRRIWQLIKIHRDKNKFNKALYNLLKNIKNKLDKYRID
ncbi:uncharacterized protein DUF616 [Halanaerobium saccharolyticum]|uniref:Uncharacterized protein DUF616 n=1 Tax=Halanaerobium saccharolyticum TaxID=43595 RepID=A0A4R6LZ44_9FIRM|nr:glycosyltransferase domain-containing protein [Halanaerobium saccharolyticum]TDO94083.1 uncharacterized protein DUF616 [Halanaerobium saccharolyticum]